MASNGDLFGTAARKEPPVRPGLKRQDPAPQKTASKTRNLGTPDETGYTAASIEVLEGLEPVRRRPGMYIGGTDEAALHHLFAEALDNAMDEAVAGHASFIDVRLEASGLSHRDRQWARHSDRPASEISRRNRRSKSS